MKRVFSTIGETCHAWAHDWRRLGNGRNSTGNIYFQQNVIYSYGSHFPMAAFVEACAGGVPLVVVATRPDAETTVDVVCRLGISHLLSRSGAGDKFVEMGAGGLRTTVEKILQGDLFGLGKYLPGFGV